MLDVHPPEHTPHNWRDFFIHIATIVIGLLIAIALEQSVEWLHHRHIVHAARESLNAEMAINRRFAREDLGYTEATAAGMQHNLELVNRFQSDPHAFDQQKMGFTMQWSGFQSSAWRTARDTGALALMPADEVERYADIYDQQQIVNEEATRLFDSEPQTMAPMLAVGSPTEMSHADAHEFAQRIASTELELGTLRDLLRGLVQTQGS